MPTKTSVVDSLPNATCYFGESKLGAFAVELLGQSQDGILWDSTDDTKVELWHVIQKVTDCWENVNRNFKVTTEDIAKRDKNPGSFKMMLQASIGSLQKFLDQKSYPGSAFELANWKFFRSGEQA